MTSGEIVDLTKEKNWITPDYEVPYLPKKESVEFFSWVNMVFGEQLNKTPKMHYMLVDEMLSKNDDVNALIHREGAKTTVLVMMMSLYFATRGDIPNFGRVTNLMIFSGTFDQTVDIIKGIQSLWENSEILQGTLKLSRNKFNKLVAYTERYICFDVPGKFVEVKKRGKIVKRQQRLHISARSIGASMRGTQKEGSRINCAMFDDILLDSILTSKKEREKLLSWYTSVFMPAVDTKGCKKVGVGTPMMENDLMMRWTMGTTFHSIKFPIMKEFTTRKDKIVSSWKDLHTPERIMKKYKEYVETGTENVFFREMMLEVINEKTRMFKKENIRWYNEYELKRVGELNTFTSMDLATSKEEAGDETAIITIGVDKDDNWFVLQVAIAQMDAIQAMDELFSQVRKFKTIMFKAEKAALQQILNDFIDKKQIKERTYFDTGALERNSSVGKSYRILALQPKINLKKLYLPRERNSEAVDKLYKQILGYTMEGKTTDDDDAIDCLANFTEEGFVFAPMGEDAWTGQ